VCSCKSLEKEEMRGGGGRPKVGRKGGWLHKGGGGVRGKGAARVREG
jgi:hypothetical protein